MTIVDPSNGRITAVLPGSSLSPWAVHHSLENDRASDWPASATGTDSARKASPLSKVTGTQSVAWAALS